MEAVQGSALEMSSDDYQQIRDAIYRLCGIDLGQGKEALVRARLSRRLCQLQAPSYAAYLRRLGSDRAESLWLIDALTTNETFFFREDEHFEFLRHTVLQTWDSTGPIRIWSAGCSTGQEPLTLAMVLCESLPHLSGLDLRILGTDISRRALARARQAEYSLQELKGVPPELLQRYWQPSQTGEGAFVARPSLTRWIAYSRLNLMVPAWPMQGPFDLIVCRNVMIYFDLPTKTELVRRFAALLRPGGHLFTGHSESFGHGIDDLTYLRPATYRKDE